jgi:hypothetical protein
MEDAHMKTARYKFVRHTRNAAGLMSNQRPSTNAINALNAWMHAGAGRSFAEILDDHDSLVADLTWSDADVEAGPSLEGACLRVGVERSHLPT